MKAKIWLLVSLLSLAGVATAQSRTATEITDPAKIAEIERHAQALATNQPTRAHMGHKKMHKKWHKKHKKMHKNMEKKAPEGDAPMMEQKG